MNTRSGKRQPRSKERLQGIMVYIPVDLNVRLAKYAEEWRISKSHIVRDGIESRIVGVNENPYVKGFNHGHPVVRFNGCSYVIDVLPVNAEDAFSCLHVYRKSPRPTSVWFSGS